MKSLSIYLLLVGTIWALVVGWIFLTLSGIAEPISGPRVILYFGGLLAGPLILIVGPILILNGTYTKPGAVLAMLGCAVLTVFVVYQSVQALHVEPLQVKPPYLLYLAAVIVTLLSDAGAFRLYQLTSNNVR